MKHEREFQQSGDLASLDNALATRKYLGRNPDAPFVSTEARIGNLQAVSRLLQQRFRAAGALEDINGAVSEADIGVLDLPEGHPVRYALLGELGNALNLRFRELRDPNDIDHAISIFGTLAALPDTPGRKPEDQHAPQDNLAVALLDRYDERKDLGDLNRSIELLRQVVNATPSGSPRRLLRVNNLGSALYFAFRDGGDQVALREAITFQREAAQSMDATFRTHAITALARSLDAAQQIGELDVEDPAPLFRQACQLGLQIHVGTALWAGMTWGRTAWSRGDLDAAAEAYGYCSQGARKLFTGQSDEANKEIRLSQFAEVAPRAALALAHAGRVDDAVLVFELSRAQLLIQAIERGLTLHHAPDLDAVNPAGMSTQFVPAHQALDIDDIIQAAQDTPLVYLVSTDRGGLALLVHKRKITQIKLPRLNTQTVAEQVQNYLTGLASPRCHTRDKALDTTTAWLWDVAMGPVLDELFGVDAVVLVPGGLLGLLPLHAAWTPDASRPSGRRYALDMATLSFVPSARSLLFARAQSTQPPAGAAAGKVLIVANPELQFSNDEAKIVAWHFPLAETVPENKASVLQVSSLLTQSTLAHLACHGFADLDTPLQSGLVLAGDEVLRVRQVRDLHVNSRLVVLSACETAVAGTPLPDEVIALPTGLLQAGCAGIVASLWPVSDRATTMLMGEFYRLMKKENQGAAAALRGAQQWLRDTTNAEKVRVWEEGAGDWLPSDVAERLCSSLEKTAELAQSSPWWWAAFVHVGV
jgi:CHAT domain-containing protein